MIKKYLLLLTIISGALHAQNPEKPSEKPFLSHNLTLSNQEFGAVLIHPKEGPPVSGVVKKLYRDDFLLDIDGIFKENSTLPSQDRSILIPKDKKSIDVLVKTDAIEVPGTVFRGRSGLYRLDVNNILTKNGYYRYRYYAHTLEIAISMGLDINFKLFSSDNAVFVNRFVALNIYTENRKKNARGYSPLLQFRFGYGTSPSLEEPILGFLLGGSQYLFDYRSSLAGIGWSMLANGGMSFDFPLNIPQNRSFYPFTLGGELEFKAIYNFHRYVGVSFGLQMGYYFVPMGLARDENFYDQNVRINLSAGLIF
ncbi:MAG: hypothetical protein ACRC9L_02140 [Brevinema sp.]